MDELILVDSKDNVLGYADKEKCHRMKPILHRAFSVFLFNSRGEILLTKRSSVKKTWPSFWSNACCSHPRKDEDTMQAAQRRTKEELGISVPLKYLFKFEYYAEYDQHWGENELDHVFIGAFNGEINPDEAEISEWKFLDVNELRRDIKQNPNHYTPWFKLCLERVLESVKK